MTCLLRIENLHLEQGGKTLLEALNLCIHPGECWGLLGRNGAGKTTLLHTLAGVRQPTQGALYWHDQALPQLPARTRAQHIGLLTQDASEGFEESVQEAALVGRHPHIARFAQASAEDQRLVRQALADCGLEDFAARRLSSLSGGERRRLALATLLAQNPRLLLLDEPLNHLDLAWQWRILQQLRALADAGRGLMLSLHDPNMALHFCTHVLLLDGSATWVAGKTKAVLTSNNLYAAYGFRLRLVHDNGSAWFVPPPSPL